MHLAKHSLMAADLHKNCVSIHCAPIKVNCNLFIISLNLIYCKMNSIYRCSNSCANHSSSHWTGLCCLRHSSSCFRDQSAVLNFPKRWPCALHPAQAPAAPRRWLRPTSLVSPCPAEGPPQPAGTHACSVEEAGTAGTPSGFLPWPALLPAILTHHWSQGQWLPRQQPLGHRVLSLGQDRDSSPHLTFWVLV